MPWRAHTAKKKTTRRNAHFLNRMSLCLAGRIRPIFGHVDTPRRAYTNDFRNVDFMVGFWRQELESAKGVAVFLPEFELNDIGSKIDFWRMRIRCFLLRFLFLSLSLYLSLPFCSSLSLSLSLSISFAPFLVSGDSFGTGAQHNAKMGVLHQSMLAPLAGRIRVSYNDLHMPRRAHTVTL